MSNSLRKITLSALSGAALLVSLASAADASLVSIGYGVDGGPVAVAAGTNTTTFTDGATVLVTAAAAPLLLTDLLDTTSLNIFAVGTHTINVVITAQNLTGPLG